MNIIRATKEKFQRIEYMKNKYTLFRIQNAKKKKLERENKKKTLKITHHETEH